MSPSIPQDNDSGRSADWEAIGRFLAGESVAQEAETMRRWLDANPANAALIAALDGVLEQGLVAQTALNSALVDVEGALARAHVSMAQETELPVRSIATARSLRRWNQSQAGGRSIWRVGALAAAALVVVALGTQRWRESQRPDGTQVATTYSTPIGSRQTVGLPDGSQVILAPGSRLTVAAGFSANQRIVQLEGAAYFTVVHDSRHPFAVRAGSAIIRDLGTAFSVKTVSGAGVMVAVREGSVSLADSATRNSAPLVELRAGDRGTVRPNAEVIAQRGGAAAYDPSWSGDSLVFRDASLSEVQADLRRWYGVELVVADSALAGRTVTNTSGAQESGQHVAKVIASILDAELQQRGDTAILVKARGRQRP